MPGPPAADRRCHSKKTPIGEAGEVDLDRRVACGGQQRRAGREHRRRRLDGDRTVDPEAAAAVGAQDLGAVHFLATSVDALRLRSTIDLTSPSTPDLRISASKLERKFTTRLTPPMVTS